VQATSRYLLRVFGPGPTRSGVSSAHSTPAVMTRARISMHAQRTAFAARASIACTNPSDGRGTHLPARAGDRVPVVLRDPRGHRRRVDDLMRRGNA
jgi:hypothetical protein